jgi:phage-related protein
MSVAKPLKPLQWVGSSHRHLRQFPDDVQDVMGFAIHLAQEGGKHDAAKPMKGFGGAGVLEVVEDYKGDTYRAVYTVKLANAVYVLHAFQKKSNQGNKTSKHDIQQIESCLKSAEEHSKGVTKAKETPNAKSR